MFHNRLIPNSEGLATKRLTEDLLIRAIRVYQKVFSPYLGGQCRFYPTCSEYAILAIKKDGPLKGTLKSVWRIIRCNPFNQGGTDYP